MILSANEEMKTDLERTKRAKNKLIKRAVSALPVSKDLMPRHPPAETPVIVSAETDFYAEYLYPEEMVDSPDYWDNEFSYFGQVQVSTTGTPPTPDEPWYKKIISAVTAAYQMKQQLALQKELNRLNIERAKAGLPPISAKEYVEQTAPTARVVVEPESGLKNMLIIGGIGLAAIVLFPQLLGRKR